LASITQDFGVQSYCFRGMKENVDVAAAVKQIGLNKIEICAVHCDFSKPETFDAVIQTYADAGIAIQSIGVESMNSDEAEMRKRFDFVKACGAKHVSVNFSPDTFDQAHPIVQKLAEQYDVRCGIHNHGGHHWLGNAQMLGYVFSQVGDRIGLCLDTAWALHATLKPIQLVEKFASRLFAIHLKDFKFHSPDGKHEDVVVGTGNIDLPAFKAACDAAGFNGETILEYEGDQDNPVPTLSKCVEAIRAVN
jgi:inosose dehydratase